MCPIRNPLARPVTPGELRAIRSRPFIIPTKTWVPKDTPEQAKARQRMLKDRREATEPYPVKYGNIKIPPNVMIANVGSCLACECPSRQRRICYVTYAEDIKHEVEETSPERIRRIEASKRRAERENQRRALKGKPPIVWKGFIPGSRCYAYRSEMQRGPEVYQYNTRQQYAWDRLPEEEIAASFGRQFNHPRRTKTKAVRLNESGDVRSDEDIRRLYRICRMLPHIPFYIYTARTDLKEWNKNKPKNLVINVSGKGMGKRLPAARREFVFVRSIGEKKGARKERVFIHGKTPPGATICPGDCGLCAEKYGGMALCASNKGPRTVYVHEH